MKTIFAKYNRERLQKYQIVTKIVLDEDGHKYALKEALCDEAKEHIENIYTNYELLKSSYDINLVKPTKLENGLLFEIAEGKSLENILLDSLDKNDAEEFKRYINKFLSFVDLMVTRRNVEFIPSLEFEAIFGKWEATENEDIIEIANVDLIFGNIFVNEKDEFSLIDYEWVFDFEIPKSYVVWRTINLFNLNCFDQQKNNLLESYINNFFNINQFLKSEEFFYNYVLGNKKKYFLPQKVLKQTYNNETKKNQAIEEKQEELIKVSDWATQLKEQVDILEKQLFDKNMSIEEKQAELIKISDWAMQMNTRLNKIENNFILRNIEKILNKEKV